MKVFILLSIAAVAFGQDCGVNQYFTDCGTSCPLTCENYKDPPKFCNLMCNIGCECDEGFVLTKDGRCVLPQQCPQEAQQCGINQHFTECGTSCPLTCENYKNPPKFCNYMCNIGCECDEGFVLTKDGRCVQPQQCPQEAQLSLAPQSVPSICLQEKVEGPCRALFWKYFYNKETGKCEKFSYGGCQGNSNRFNTLEDCEAVCSEKPTACQKEKDGGPCKGSHKRFFFNKQTRKCEQFIYGGCEGNANNFLSEEDCEAVCYAKPSAPTACQEEKVVGPCKAAFRRYFFSRQTGKCELFIYGGCQGNSNNFNSQEDCEAVCLA